jgi:peptidoglycan/LPS O-acetylase OafA/YrhL
MKKEHYSWVDYARGIVIILVVVRHTLEGMVNANIAIPAPLFTAVRGFINGVNMPLSFFLSGLFFIPSFIKRTPNVFISDKIKILLWPFLIWSLIQTTISLALSGHVNKQVGAWDLLTALYNPRIQLWFVYTLFLMFLISAIIHSISKKGVYITFGLSILMYFLCDYNFGNTSIIRLFECFIYFNLGVLLQTFWLGQSAMPKSWWLTLALGFAFALIAYLDLSGKMERTLATRFLMAFSWIAFFVLLAQHFSNTKAFEMIRILGKYSFPVYLAHIVFTSGSRVVGTKILHLTNLPLLFCIILLMGIIAPLILFRLTENTRFAFLFQYPPYLSRQSDKLTKMFAVRRVPVK